MSIAEQQDTPTDHFTILEPKSWSTDFSELYKSYSSVDFEGLKFRNVRSGKKSTQLHCILRMYVYVERREKLNNFFKREICFQRSVLQKDATHF